MIQISKCDTKIIFLIDFDGILLRLTFGKLWKPLARFMWILYTNLCWVCPLTFMRTRVSQHYYRGGPFYVVLVNIDCLLCCNINLCKTEGDLYHKTCNKIKIAIIIQPKSNLINLLASKYKKNRKRNILSKVPLK